MRAPTLGCREESQFPPDSRLLTKAPPTHPFYQDRLPACVEGDKLERRHH